MNQTINSEYSCQDCKFYDGYCKVYGLDVPDVCGDFVMSDENALLDSEEDYV